MNKKYLAMIGMAFAVGFTQPIYAEETTATTEASVLTPEAFTAQYSEQMDKLIELTKGNKGDDVLMYMYTSAYTELLNQLPYDGFCYPTSNGEGLKIFHDRTYYGNLVNGVAEGTGTVYKINVPGMWDRGYYTGQWKNDAPNGEGSEWASGEGKSKKRFRVMTSGNYVNWYQDGDMTVSYITDKGHRTYSYHVTDKVPDVIEKKTIKGKELYIVAYAEESSKSFLTYYNTAQTVLHQPIDDGNRKNSHGFYYTGID